MRDYPVKVNLTNDELELLERLSTERGVKSSETLREAVEYAAAFPNELEDYIQARKLKAGQELFCYRKEPREIRNARLLEALVEPDGTLRCKLLLAGDSVTAKLYPSDCKAQYNNGVLSLICSVRNRGHLLISSFSICSDSITSVSVYDERTNRSEAFVPSRFEALTEYEYLQIEIQ